MTGTAPAHGLAAFGTWPAELTKRRLAGKLLSTAAVAAGLIALYFLVPIGGTGWPYGIGVAVLAIVGLVPFSLKRCLAILQSPHPLLATVDALVLLLVVQVLAFSTTHYAIATHSPSQYAGLHTKTDSLYFTVTTLATVGFGDIHAAGQAARVITTVDIVFNLVFVGAVIRLVGWAGRRGLATRAPERASGGPPDTAAL